ncbi:hypothetical protein ACJRO0_12270 [Acetobacter oryzifermentans]|uniref:hypothetical protein n=1 Tax=Acetobacter oryzifermentans TaxID=1633874 RepID=UPI0039BFF901
MTVIVWKDGVLAADSQAATEYGCITSSARKVQAIGKYLVGVSGTAMALGPIADWVRNDCKGNLPEKIGGQSYGALIIGEYTGAIVENGGIQYVSREDPQCIGSGAEIAYGALHMGASAVEAVEAAIARSIYCGGAVYTVVF